MSYRNGGQASKLSEKKVVEDKEAHETRWLATRAQRGNISLLIGPCVSQSALNLNPLIVLPRPGSGSGYGHRVYHGTCNLPSQDGRLLLLLLLLLRAEQGEGV